MGTPLALKIVVILALMLQFVAIVYALRLVRRTKYSAIWILCVIGFVLIGVERYFEVIGIENDQVGLYISIALGVVVSICISVAVLFARHSDCYEVFSVKESILPFISNALRGKVCFPASSYSP